MVRNPYNFIGVKVRGYEVTIISDKSIEKLDCPKNKNGHSIFLAEMRVNYRNSVTSYHNISINMIDLTLNSNTPEVTIIINVRHLS